MCKLNIIKRDYKGEQFNFLNIKIKDLTRDNSFLLNFIVDLLQALYDIFRNILQFGKDKEKDIVISKVNDCYDRILYNDSKYSSHYKKYI